MADDGEEDYMSDLSRFLPPDNTSKPSNKLCSKRGSIPQPSSKKPKTLNWQEQRKLTREQKQEEEDKKIISSLDSAIPQSNIGFKMLKQMGYTPGSALGKEGGFGRIDPVGIEIRRSRAGIGREDPRKEKIRMEEEKMVREKNREKELMVDFGSRKKEQWKNRRVVVDYHKAKAAFEQLENKEVEVEQEKKSDDEEQEEEKKEEIITEEDLEEMLMKLRDEYEYCLYCGCRYESKDALLSGCPGINEDDH
ncbi:G patch domain-containing protein 11 [Impatiens glandulifera]|uniref:G patch domain-containing protein 11 n=1 Tax=Impatiens glandulifera TaxID=253017 RepID=UPI001FB09F61|nr:G patch domain-containing protein 11 [Impatiens glandulifera]